MTTREGPSEHEQAALLRGLEELADFLEHLIERERAKHAGEARDELAAPSFYSWLQDRHVPVRLVKDGAP